MISNGKKIVYGINLNDYFTAGFCSAVKTYFGSQDEINSFIKDRETHEAFRRFLNGETEVTHYVAYHQHRLIETVEFIAEGEINIDKTTWEFLNVWHFPQHMEIDSGTIKMMLLKHEKTYFRAIKPSVIGLRTAARPNAPIEECLKLCGGFWGHPGILVVNEDEDSYAVQSTLYMKEKEYATEQEALEKFRTDTVCLDCMCEDVFGDG